MAKRITLEEAKQEFISKGYIPLFDEYKNARTKLLALNKQGYKVSITLDNLKRGFIPNPFNSYNPWSIENINKWLKMTNRNCTVLKRGFGEDKDKLHCKCDICGNEWGITWDNLSAERSCPICSKQESAIKRTLTLEQVKNKLYKINPNIEILSEEYSNARQKLKCRCKIHNNIWYITWADLSREHGCPICAKISAHGNGTYNINMAERNKDEWKNKNAIVYVIKCWKDEEIFYKIGITTNEVKTRFCSNMPYKFEVIDELYTNLYNAIYVESKAHKEYSNFAYNPKIHFGGHTECFLNNEIFENIDLQQFYKIA